jgi:hypothetical protein
MIEKIDSIQARKEIEKAAKEAIGSKEQLNRVELEEVSRNMIREVSWSTLIFHGHPGINFRLPLNRIGRILVHPVLHESDWPNSLVYCLWQTTDDKIETVPNVTNTALMRSQANDLTINAKRFLSSVPRSIHQILQDRDYQRV